MERSRLLDDAGPTRNITESDGEFSSGFSSNSERENLTDFETLFNVCCGITGTGILAMAFVFRCTGIWALIVIPIIAITGNYTGQLLIDLLYEVDENGMRYRAREGYLDIGEHLLPNFGRVFVNATNLVENFAHCVLILLLTGGIMNEIVPILTDDIWTVLCALPLFTVVFLERIRSLSKIAIATVTIGIVLLSIATAYSLRFHDRWTKSFETAKLFELKRFSIGVGITVVTYACQPYLPFIEKDMANRENFGKVMNISYAIITVVKIISGLFIYLAYENKTHAMMTLDLPHGPLRTICSMLLFVVALTFFIFPMFTVFNIVDQNWPKSVLSSNSFQTIRYFVRLALLILAMIVAVFTPHFGLGISLVGNFTANLLVFILPCICHIKFNYPNLKMRYLVIDVLILVTCIVFGAIGIFSSIDELLTSVKDENLNPTEPLENL